MRLKHLFILFVAAVTLLTSCHKKTVRIESSNIEGLLTGAFEAVPGEYEITKEDGEMCENLELQNSCIQ